MSAPIPPTLPLPFPDAPDASGTPPTQPTPPTPAAEPTKPVEPTEPTEPTGIPAFDLTGPLPEPGTITLLEASAGTGKTYTVAALVVRMVAEGVVTLDELLVVTFGRAASQELRDRVRAALVAAERRLAADAPDSLAGPTSDELDRHLLALPDRAVVRERLQAALASFDAATIATTHQFCQLVLRSLGVAGDTDPGSELVDDLDQLVGEVVDDLYLRRYADDSTPPIEHAEAREVAAAAVGDPQARLVPDGLDPQSRPGARVSFAGAVRAELDRRKRARGVLGYDDLLSRLAAALASPDSPARQRMRRRWRVVLVDEFQDTDPVQWQVVERAFGGHATAVLVGDPKQAIYAFRGGDVMSYLAARAAATHEMTLGDNRRSDAALVRALGVLLGGAQLGDPRIVVRPVRAAREGERLEGAPSPAPLRLRVLERTGRELSQQDLLYAADARRHIARDCAADIARLLGSRATFEGRPIQARDVAVLVRVREHGVLVQEALRDRGVHAVVAGGGHVVVTAAGDHWLTLLEALEAPQRTARVRAAALTPFVGESAESLAAGGDAVTDRVAERLRVWGALMRRNGIAAVAEAAEEQGMAARVLRQIGGERLLTDLRHMGQLVHEVATAERLGGAELLAWLREQRRLDRPTTDRTRRLDSDAAAVQVLTVHASKGLQFPVVYLPFDYEQRSTGDDRLLSFHDEAGARCLDVSGGGHPGWGEHRRRHTAEASAEALRLTYVALTRAQSQVVAWWAPTRNTPLGGLHRLILGRVPEGAQVPDAPAVPSDAAVERAVRLWAQLGGPAYEPSVVDEPHRLPSPPAGRALEHRRFGRTLDADWRRTSYSALVRVEPDADPGVASEPEVAAVADEDAEPAPAPQAALLPGGVPGPRGLPSPMADLPAGATFGSLVHAVLEHAEPQAPDLRAELRARVAEQLRWWPVDTGPDDLADALLPLHHTPLGPLAPGVTLLDVPQADRLRELDFELPLAGGDRPGATPPLLGELAALLRTHLPATDPLLPYAARLERPPLTDHVLRGYLAGSVDAVLRVPGPDGPRFLVVDYKTNLLGDPDLPVTTDDYRFPRLVEAMLHSHYPLQALLYCVVVHRLLRWRLPGYRPEQHLGGVLYLFLRGMAGPDTPAPGGHPTGVFSWRPPVALVEELSALLDGRVASTGGVAS